MPKQKGQAKPWHVMTTICLDDAEYSDEYNNQTEKLPVELEDA